MEWMTINHKKPWFFWPWHDHGMGVLGLASSNFPMNSSSLGIFQPYLMTPENNQQLYIMAPFTL